MSFELFWKQTLEEFIFLLKAPTFAPELWWIITPLIITTILMTFYFAKHIKEGLGWNTAFSNSIVLLFVGIDVIRTMYNYTSPPSFTFIWKSPIITLVVIAIILEGFLLARIAYRHAVPSKFLFFFTSSLPINLQAYVVTIVVYTHQTPTIHTFIAAVLLFIVLFIVLRLIQEIQHLRFGYHSKKR